AGTKLWEFYIGHPVQSSAALGADGTVYFGADNGKLYAFDSQGQGKWEFPTGDALVASPALAEDGSVVVASMDGYLYAVGADGVEKWRFRSNGKIVSSPALGQSNSVFFGTMQKKFYAVNGEGVKRWELELDDAIVSSPAVARDGTIYVASLSGVLYAVDAWGKVKWTFKAADRVNSSPAIGPDGTVYFGAFDGHVYAIGPNGQKKWTFATGAAVRGSAAVGPSGVIYIGSDDRKLYAFAPDGFKLWSYATGGWVRSTPAVSSDETIYFGSYDNSLHAVTDAGAKRWEFTTDSAISASPALGPNGVIYFGGWSKRFYAVRGGQGLATSAWARFRGDARQTAALAGTLPTELAKPSLRPTFPVEGPKPLAVTTKAAAAEEFARAQAAREMAMNAKQAAAARAKAAATPPAPKQPAATAEAKRLAKAQADAEAKTAKDAKAAQLAAKNAEAEANRKMLADNARVLKDAELARKAQEQADYKQAVSASDLARKAKADAGLRAAASRKAAEDAERLAKAQQETERKTKELEAARQAAEAKVQAEADRKSAMEAARQTKLQQDAERKAAEAKAKADAQLEIEQTKRAVEENKRILKEAEVTRKQQEAEDARRAVGAAELARLAKREAEQRAAAKQAADLAEAKRVQAEALAAEAAKRRADEEAATQAKLKADTERRAALDAARQAKALQDAEQAEAARKLAEARAQAAKEAKAAAEADRLRAQEQELARKVLAASEKASREEADRQAREAAREQAEERRRVEAERKKAEPSFFRRLFTWGAATPTAVAEAPAPPVLPPPQPAVAVPVPPVVVPTPAPVAVAPVVPPAVVAVPVPAVPDVPLKIISDSTTLVRPAAPAPAPSFFSPTQPTVDPLAEQIELLKQRAAAAQVAAPVPAPAHPVAHVEVAPAVAQPLTVAQPTAEPAAAERPGFWSRVGGFFIRTRKNEEGQQPPPPGAQRPLVVQPSAAREVKVAAQAQPPQVPAQPQPQVPTQVPPGLAPAGVTSTNFPRIQYEPVAGQSSLFLNRAQAMQTNLPGMPQPPAPPREVREMRPGKVSQQGLVNELPSSAPAIELIQTRVKAVLRVYSTGAGRVSPDLNGAELEVGQTYTIEAQPARGGVFLGWTGSIETNSPVLRFVMRTGTVLAANFQFAYNLERELPEVAIISPADGARLTAPVIALQGAARDNLAVARVEVSVNNGPWELAQGTDNWAFPVTARPGPVYVRVRAVDQAGNESQPLLRTLFYSVPSVLTVRVNGAGIVTPDWSGKLLDIGGAYELRATPAAGHVFAGWSGSVTGTAATMPFTMQSNLVVEATFVPRLASLARGVFNGLVYPTNSLAPTKCGFFALEVAADSTFTGFLRQGTASHPLAGRFDANGQATATVTRAGQSTVTLALQLDPTAGERLMGRFDDDGTAIEMFAYRQVHDGRASVSPLAGRYTFVMPSSTNSVDVPAGDAFGEIVVDGAGRVSFAGELPDGTPVRHEAIMGRNGLWPLHVPLAGGRGMLLGWITVSKDPNLDAFGEVIWHKPLAPQDRFYPGGFSTRRHLFGNLYAPTSGNIDLPRATGGMLSGGDMPKVILGTSGLPYAGVTQLARFNWNFRPETGFVEGSFIHPTTQQETTFRGALLQKRGWTSGYFLGQTHSGVVHLQIPQ
ncbi:MAG: hypothetical protein B9S33_21540, partial [Pedosphaera sp. Tous-C6FEB]